MGEEDYKKIIFQHQAGLVLPALVNIAERIPATVSILKDFKKNPFIKISKKRFKDSFEEIESLKQHYIGPNGGAHKKTVTNQKVTTDPLKSRSTPKKFDPATPTPLIFKTRKNPPGPASNPNESPSRENYSKIPYDLDNNKSNEYKFFTQIKEGNQLKSVEILRN